MIESDGKLLALDLKSESNRDEVAKVDDSGVKDLLEQFAGNYS